MKISGRKPLQNATPFGAANEAGKADKANATPVPGAARGDNIQISSATKQMMNAKAAIDGMPDIRLERVSEIRNQVDDGAYHVESEKNRQKNGRRIVERIQQ